MNALVLGLLVIYKLLHTLLDIAEQSTPQGGFPYLCTTERRKERRKEREGKGYESRFPKGINLVESIYIKRGFLQSSGNTCL